MAKFKKQKPIPVPRKKQDLINLKSRITRDNKKINKELDKLYEIGNNKLTKEQKELRNDLFTRQLQNNGLTKKVQERLNKVVKKPKKDKLAESPNKSFEYLIAEDFIITEKSNAENLIITFEFFNNLKRSVDAEKIQDIINVAWGSMDSKDAFRVEYNPKKDGIGYILRDGRLSAKDRDSEFEPS
jgi:hypothetical protein